MNFTFKIDDVVRFHESNQEYVLIRGFDPTAKSFRIWLMDPIENGVPNPKRRVRTYSSKLVRVRRPSEELEAQQRSEAYKKVKAMAAIRKRTREAEAQVRALKKEKRISAPPPPSNFFKR